MDRQFLLMLMDGVNLKKINFLYSNIYESGRSNFFEQSHKL